MLGVASIQLAGLRGRDRPSGLHRPQPPPVTFNVTGGDGGYTVEMSATGNNGMVEVVHSSHLILDNTPPAITIVEPTATDYPHSAVLTLDYSASDGLGSGVASLTATLDGSSTLAGHGLGDGQAINLLFELSLGEHTFVVNSKDRVENGSQQSVTFAIIVTPESIKQDVQIFLDAGLIKDPGTATALLAKLNAAAEAFAGGNCARAASHYGAFIKLLQAQTPAHVDATAAAIMIADAEYPDRALPIVRGRQDPAPYRRNGRSVRTGRNVLRRLAKSGRGDWIRTSGLSVPNRALYQAEPRPDGSPSYLKSGRYGAIRSDRPGWRNRPRVGMLCGNCSKYHLRKASAVATTSPTSARRRSCDPRAATPSPCETRSEPSRHPHPS